MQTIKNQGAQGDVLFRRIKEMPVDVGAEVAREPDGSLVLAHSETGHHHAILGAPDARLIAGPSSLISYLQISEGFADVEHLRPFDTHETLRLPAGTWEVRRQREHTPEGWRRVED